MLSVGRRCQRVPLGSARWRCSAPARPPRRSPPARRTGRPAWRRTARTRDGCSSSTRMSWGITRTRAAAPGAAPTAPSPRARSRRPAPGRSAAATSSSSCTGSRWCREMTPRRCNARQPAGDLLGEAAGEVLVVRPPEVLERQHGEHRPPRGRSTAARGLRRTSIAPADRRRDDHRRGRAHERAARAASGRRSARRRGACARRPPRSPRYRARRSTRDTSSADCGRSTGRLARRRITSSARDAAGPGSPPGDRLRHVGQVRREQRLRGAPR